jgi:hypothetical protein
MRPQTYRGGERQTPEVEMERAGTTNHPNEGEPVES